MNSYFFLDEQNQQKGPISPEQFGAYGVTPNTMVWCNGMATWKHANDVPELQAYLNTADNAGANVPPPTPSNDFSGNTTSGYADNTVYSQPSPQPNNMGYNNAQGYQNYNNQGYSQGNQYGPQQNVCPENNMVWAILCTILCCLPLGIVSIVYASKVKGLYYQGDTAGALDAAQKARNWAIGGAISGLVVSIIYSICVIASGAFAAL